MRTYTTKHIVYKFDELSKEAQEKALEKHREFIGENLELDSILDDFVEDLEANGSYSDVKCWYSGFWSQGDGACFEATVDVAKWLQAHKLVGKYRKLYNNADETTIVIKHRSNYYYATSTVVESECFMSDNWQPVDKQLMEVTTLIEAEREDLGNNLYRQLQKEYEYQLSDEVLRDNINANEYEFTKEGVLA